MNGLVTHVEYNDDIFKVAGSFDFPAADLWLCIRRREMEHGLEYPEEYRFKPVIEDGLFFIEENINDLLKEKKLYDGAIWDLYMIDDGEYVQVEMDDSANDLKELDYRILSNRLFKVKPYVTGQNGLSLLVLQNSILAVESGVKYEGGLFTVSVQTQGDITLEELKEKTVTLKAKRREQEQLFEYYETKTLQPASTQTGLLFEIDMDSFFFNDAFSKKYIWDLFIEISDTSGAYIDLPLESYSENKRSYQFNYYDFQHNDLYRVKPYVTGLNTVALLINRANVSAVIDHIDFENNRLTVEGVLQSTEYDMDNLEGLTSFLIVKKRQKVGNEFVYNTERSTELSVVNLYFEVKTSLSDLLVDDVIRDKDVWDIFVRVTTMNGCSIDIPLQAGSNASSYRSAYEVMENHSSIKFKPFVNGKGELSLYFIGHYQDENQVKLAVLGSCFSRNAFNSKAYFNPDYKQYYSCDYTQFHSSLISLTSREVPIEVDELEDLNEQNKEFVRSDFQKDFFQKLEDANPDYVIIDLYADAAREVIRVSEDQFISASLSFRQSSYFKNFLGYDLLTHANNDHYFSVWKKAMAVFAERITDVIPEDRVILSLGGFTYTYYDKDGSIKKFSSGRRIKANNYFWDRLNNHFLQCLPNCKIINMKDTKYIGDANHPFGRSYSHYESGYYKEFMQRVNELVLVDYNKRRNTTNFQVEKDMQVFI